MVTSCKEAFVRERPYVRSISWAVPRSPAVFSRCRRWSAAGSNGVSLREASQESLYTGYLVRKMLTWQEVTVLLQVE